MIEDENIIDEEDDNEQEYSPKSDFSKALIIANAITRTANSRGEEMIEGYFNFKFDKDGNAVKVWIPDARKIFCSNVDATIQLLSPEIIKDKRMNKVIIEFEKQKNILFQTYCYKEKRRIELPNGEYGWELTGSKWIPKIDEQIETEDPIAPRSLKTTYEKGLYNNIINRYWDNMLQLYDKIFAEINLLIGSSNVNYFKKGSRY
ncbi:MAG: hypothetical protein EHM47_00890 [Ignavibacteriales bacterium]|nr:MAG: hypothetical protein EHM47_00890 [Ignavibacteriales bacterium]